MSPHALYSQAVSFSSDVLDTAKEELVSSKRDLKAIKCKLESENEISFMDATAYDLHFPLTGIGQLLPTNFTLLIIGNGPIHTLHCQQV